MDAHSFCFTPGFSDLILSDFCFFVPELFLTFALCTLFLFSVSVLLFRTSNKSVPTTFSPFSILFLFTVLVSFVQYLFCFSIGVNGFFFGGYLKADLVTLLFKIFILGFFFVYALIVHGFCQADRRFLSFEFSLLLFFSLIGMVLLVSTDDLVLFYLTLELQSFAFYILTSFSRFSPFSSEAGVKYFVLGSVASSVLLFGISLIYGFSGSTDLNHFFIANSVCSVSTSVYLDVGSLFFLAGVLFKIGVAPFHVWVPDVYDGAPLPVMVFFSSVVKLAPFFFFCRFIYRSGFSSVLYWFTFIVAASLLSLFIGTFGAFYQSRVKRFFAYTSISHAGFILLALVTSPLAFFFYLITYVFSGLGFFAALFSVKRVAGAGVSRLDDLKLFFSSHPLLALFLSIQIFSMAGLPPLSGFFAKFYTLSPCVSWGWYELIASALFLSVVGSFYYLRLVRGLFFDRAAGQRTLFRIVSSPASLVAYFVSLFNFFFVFSPDLFLFPLQVLVVFLGS